MKAFDSWPAGDVLDWLGNSGNDYCRNFDRNLQKVLGSNPILSGTMSTHRPLFSGSGVPRQLIIAALGKRKAEFEKASTNAEVHRAVLRAVTEQLAHLHYMYVSSQVPSLGFAAQLGEFWFPATYFVRGFRPLFQFYFITEEGFHAEFYDRPPKSPHPAIIVECLANGRFSMMPFTHSFGNGRMLAPVTESNGNCDHSAWAVFDFLFAVSSSMLDKIGTRDSYGRSISDSDFKKLLGKCK